MIRSVLLWASGNRWLGRVLPSRASVRRAVRRFMPGESRDEAVAAGRELANEGFGLVYTRLGEDVTSIQEVKAVVEEYEALLEDLDRERQDAHLAVKLTQLGLRLDEGEARRSLFRLLGGAKEKGVFVWIDMEDSALRVATLRLFRSAADEYGPSSVGICLQSYLRESPNDLRGLLPLGPTVRIVKGAYAESPSVAFPKKKDVDESFFALATQLTEGGGRVGFATHDPDLVGRFRTWAQAREGDPGRYEFQFLYGIRLDLQQGLLEAGEPVRVLISYGPEWFPWYMRRLAERPANLWFVLRNLFRG